MLKRIIRIFAAVYLTYLALCLLILLPAMNILAPRMVEQTTGRSLSSELLLFNPFTLALELRGVALNAKADGNPALVAFDRARVNLSTASLWNEGVVLDELLLDGLIVDIRQREDGGFNFSDLLPGESAADDSAAELPAFTVRHIDFQADHLDFSDETRSPPYRTHIDDIAFTVNALSTVQEAGSPYQLSIVMQHGGRLDWRGDLSLATQKSAGRIRLSDIDLRPAYRYLQPQLAFAVDSALLDVSGNYRASWRDSPAFQVDDGQVALRSLRLRPDDSGSLPDTAVNLDAMTVDGISVDSAERRIQVKTLDLDALEVSGFSEGDTHSLVPMFVPAGGPPGPARQEAATPATSDDGEPWQISLQRLATDNTRLRWRSSHTAPELIELSPVSITLRDLAWPTQGDSAMQLSLRANDQSELAVSGTLDFGSGDGYLDYQLQSQPLSWFNPLLADVLRATIDDGELQLDGSVTLTDHAPDRVALETRVDRFALRIFGRDASALSWNSLSIPGIRVDLQEQSVAVGKVDLEGYFGSLHILPDGRLNAQLALPEPDDSADGGNTPDTTAGADTDTGTAAVETGGNDWAIRAAGLQLRNARLDFEDESLPIPFRTLIGQLDGEIGELDSTQPDRRTEIALQGSVDGYAPVTINGNVAPFADSTALAITLHFRGVDIANLTPYSATYAGYAIDSGTLNLDLAYTLDGDRLQGDNRAVISQMVLGDPIESERALDLPLKLALALLTDARGVIDLEVPVQGNIDNPEFSLGKIIGRTLRNILTRAVTAPFRFLASLVGSDEDLQQMSFAAGTDSFSDDTRSKLDSLAEALEQRPALNVLVRGSIDPPADVRALQEQALDRQLLADGLPAAAVDARNADWEAALAERYNSIVNDGSDGADPATAADSEDISATDMQETLLAGIEIPPETLDALVRTRAAAVKRHLVNDGGIAADRVTVSGRAGDAQLAGAILDVSN